MSGLYAVNARINDGAWSRPQLTVFRSTDLGDVLGQCNAMLDSPAYNVIAVSAALPSAPGPGSKGPSATLTMLYQSYRGDNAK